MGICPLTKNLHICRLVEIAPRFPHTRVSESGRSAMMHSQTFASQIFCRVNRGKDSALRSPSVSIKSTRRNKSSHICSQRFASQIFCRKNQGKDSALRSLELSAFLSETPAAVNSPSARFTMLPLLFLNKAGRSATATLLARAAGGLRSRGAYPGCMAEQQTQGVCDQARQPLI